MSRDPPSQFSYGPTSAQHSRIDFAISKAPLTSLVNNSQRSTLVTQAKQHEAQKGENVTLSDTNGDEVCIFVIEGELQAFDKYVKLILGQLL